jgi:hypothetical protein
MSLRFVGRGWIAWCAAALMLILCIGDVLTTMYIIARGGYEGNLFMAWLMTTIGFHFALGVKIVITTGIILWLVGKWEYNKAKLAMIIVIGMHCFVVGRHLFYIIGGYV